MAARVTIQDIADALGLSRNTVSKAINNTGVIAESTRNAVLQKAAEMGYKQFSYFMPNAAGSLQSLVPELVSGVTGEIAVLVTARVDRSHFASVMLDKICSEFSKLPFIVTIHPVLTQDLEAVRLPGSVNIEKVRGIICAEILNEEYCRMLVSTNIPLLMVDSPMFLHGDDPGVDLLLMDNNQCIFNFIRTMKEQGINRFGFIGPHLHCRSFNERYFAFRLALEDLGLPLDPEFLILEDMEQEKYSYQELYFSNLRERILSLTELPDVFICANDFIAIDVMKACEGVLRFPEDVMLLGFDDSSESRLVTPSLSSIHIHSQTMGQYAVGMLYRRIQNPEIYHLTVHVETDLILRESTRRPG